MNLQDIRNPHRIYPGQQLVLDKSGGRARLRLAQAGGATAQPGAAPSEAPIPTVRLSPRIRAEGLPDTGPRPPHRRDDRRAGAHRPG